MEKVLFVPEQDVHAGPSHTEDVPSVLIDVALNQASKAQTNASRTCRSKSDRIHQKELMVPQIGRTTFLKGVLQFYLFGGLYN